MPRDPRDSQPRSDHAGITPPKLLIDRFVGTASSVQLDEDGRRHPNGSASSLRAAKRRPNVLVALW
jgi:hypothetical protein